MKQTIGQHIMIGISGLTLTEDEKKFITQNNICGVTLFNRNVQDPKQVRELCSEIQALRNLMRDRIPLFIGIDMEGGRVARLKAPFTQWPPAKKLGDLDSPTVSFHFAYALGLELKAVGINLNYSPCLDVLTNPKNTVIGDRSLSDDPKKVEKHSSALVRGFLKADIIPCVKHFPGHGNTLIDSHEDLPVEQTDLEHLHEVELVPFKRAVRSRVQLIMSSHILFKSIDPKWPVTFSSLFLKDLLRTELRYKGLIFTDDLGMKAVSKNFDKRLIPVQALLAGNDVLLYCNEPEDPPAAIQEIEKALVDGHLKVDEMLASFNRIIETKKSLLAHPEPIPYDQMVKIVGHPDHVKLSKGIAEGNVPVSLLTTPE